MPEPTLNSRRGVKTCSDAIPAGRKRLSRRRPRLEIEPLEARDNPSSTLIATSFFDSALYEFNPTTGARLATLVQPYAPSSPLSGPAGLAVGPDGNLYISSQFNNQILEYNLTSNMLVTTPFISSGELQTIAKNVTGNSNAQFAPAGLQFGPDGNLYVSMNGGQSSTSGGAVIRFPITSTGGTLSYQPGTSVVVATGLVQPSGLSFGTLPGDTNSLYVANSKAHDVVKVANATSPSFSSSTFIAPGSNGLDFPAAVTWGPDGLFYVVDLGEDTFQGNVLQFSATGTFQQFVTPTGSGQPGNLQFQFPSGILFDGQGHFLTANLGPADPPDLQGSINEYNTDGSFDQTLVSSSQFPDMGSGTSGIAPSQVALIPVATKLAYNVSVQGGSSFTAGTPFLVTVQASDQFGNTITHYTGPSSVTVTINPPSSASNFPMTVPINSNGLGYFLANLEKTGTYTITAASGSSSGTSFPLTITAGAAAKLGFGTQPVNTPTGVTLPAVTVQILDAYGNLVSSDNTDTVTLGINSGPGSFTAGSTTTATAHNGVATFNNLILVKPGVYTFSELVPGVFTGPASNAFTITPLQVVPGSFVGTPSGFSLQLNGPYLVNSVTPVLYGTGFGLGAGGTGQHPSVILTSDGGNLNDFAAYVPGTLVLNTQNNSLQFVVTDTTSAVTSSTPVLPDGVYTVVVRGTAANNGFQAVNSGGGFLDGTSSGTPGNDFTASFTVGVAAAHDDVVWVPATADGPLQTLEAPGNNKHTLNTTHPFAGLPLYIDDASGQVTSVTGTFTYNPQLLTVSGGTASSLLPGSTFTVLVTTPGTATFTYTDSGSNSAALTGGVGSNNAVIPGGAISAPALGFINATVTNGSLTTPNYRAKDVMTLSSLQINGSGTTPVVGSSAVHLVAFVGDADGNGSYSSSDAVLITKVLVSTDSGFAAYPLVDPTILADTDGSGFVPGDAALQVNEAGVGFPTANLANPPIPTGANITPIGNNVDPALRLPSNLQVSPGGTVTVPVNLDDAHPAGSTGLVFARLALTYDPRQFTVSASDIYLGSVPAAGSGWTLDAIVDQATGQIAITLSSSTPIAQPIGGSLVTIDFHQTDAAAPALPTVNLVSSVNIHGQDFGTWLDDAQGSFTLTPGLANDHTVLDQAFAQMVLGSNGPRSLAE